MINIFMMILNSLIITFMLTKLFSTVKEKSLTSVEGLNNFECGFSSIHSKLSFFSTNYFLMATMFLVFDMEIAFLIPIILSNANSLFMVFILQFMLITLTLILLKEWSLSLLEWKS